MKQCVSTICCCSNSREPICIHPRVTDTETKIIPVHANNSPKRRKRKKKTQFLLISPTVIEIASITLGQALKWIKTLLPFLLPSRIATLLQNYTMLTTTKKFLVCSKKANENCGLAKIVPPLFTRV